MVLLYATDVGDAAWQRMVRDGVVAVLGPGIGHAPTTERTSALRAASLAAAVPRRATLAGPAALWVHGWRADNAAPRRIDVAVPRGCHPDPPPGYFAPWWQFVTDQSTCAASRAVGGVSVTDVGNALRSLLCKGDLGEAVEAAWWALNEGKIDRASGAETIASGATALPRQRALAAWNAVCASSGAP